MKITGIMDDFGAPALVAVADVMTAEKFPKYNEWAAYGLAAIGQFSGYIPFVPKTQFVKNMGIAATPWAMKMLYSRVKAMTTKTSGASRMARYPSTPTVPEYAHVRLV
jgi:hypothetical protein